MVSYICRIFGYSFYLFIYFFPILDGSYPKSSQKEGISSIPDHKWSLFPNRRDNYGQLCLHIMDQFAQTYLSHNTYFRYNSWSCGFGRHLGIKQNNFFPCKMPKSWTHDYLCGLELDQFCWSELPTSNPPGCHVPSGTKSCEIPSQTHSWNCILATLQEKREKKEGNMIINCIIQIFHFNTKCIYLIFKGAIPTWKSEKP